MYEYQNAVIKHRKPDVRFEELDVRQMAIKALLSAYENIYLVLSHPTLEKKQTLDMRANETIFTSVVEGTTVEQWLIDNDNVTLPTVEGIPEVDTSFVLARDAWQSGYVIDRCVPSGSPFNDASDYDKTDIWLTRQATDYIFARDHCLVTVNGFIHRLDADNDGIYVKNGGVSFRKAQSAHVGLISFLNIGKVHTASITPEMVYQPDPTKLFSDNFYLNVPFDTTDKVMGIVIGGYLHLACDDIKVTGSNAVKVNMNRIPFLERYMVARYKIDMSSMERFHRISESNEVDYDLQAFHSNECMLELLTLSQSFIVGIEVDHLTTEILKTGRTFLPGRFYFDQRPLWPLRTELGLLPSYISAGENGVWVLRTDNNLRQHRLMNTREHRWLPTVSERRIGDQPQTFVQGDLVKWGTSKLTIVAE